VQNKIIHASFMDGNEMVDSGEGEENAVEAEPTPGLARTSQPALVKVHESRMAFYPRHEPFYHPCYQNFSRQTEF